MIGLCQHSIHVPGIHAHAYACHSHWQVQVLVEGPSKKGGGLLSGRTDGFQTIRFPAVSMPDTTGHQGSPRRVPKAGDFVAVDIYQAEDASLRGQPVAIAPLSLNNVGSALCSQQAPDGHEFATPTISLALHAQ
jgi:hypothetical protein